MLHGLGSSSYCWRGSMALLGEAGFECVAPDWPGHGASDKVRQIGCVCLGAVLARRVGAAGVLRRAGWTAAHLTRMRQLCLGLAAQVRVHIWHDAVALLGRAKPSRLLVGW